MYSLMIVDDEPIVLKAISHVVETSCPGIKVVGKTGSGIEAVSIALREKPDIVMIDIELTGLNGLDAASEIKKALPETILMIISAYDNFQYARKSIALGVMDYLLKPVSKDDIVAILAKAAQRLEEQRGKTREQLELKDKLSKIKPLLEEDLFFSLLYPGIGMHPLQDYQHSLDLQFAFGQAIEVSVADSEQLSKNFDRYKQLLKNQLFGSNCILFGPVIGRTSLILAGYDTVPDHPKSRWESIHQALRVSLDLPTGIVLGEILPGFEGMIQSFRRLRQSAWQYSFQDGVFWAGELPEPADQGLAMLWKVERDFLEAIRQGQTELARLVFTDLHRAITAVTGADWQSMKDYFQGISAVLQRILYENAPQEAARLWDGSFSRRISQTTDPAEISLVFQELIEELTQSIAAGAFPEKNPEISTAVAFMKQNYHRDITLPEIAATVAISPGYLTKLFKEHCNQTVMDFLERIRIEQALKLLKETNLSIKEITGRVGYRDPNYFSKVFKKVTHSSPTEIRD
jgi:two-component system response regulator YesN